MARRILQLAVLLGLIVTAPSLALASGGSYTTKGAWHFVSAPTLHPPKLLVLSRTSKAVHHGYFVADNLPSLGQTRPQIGEPGVMLLDSALDPVWVHGAGASGADSDLQRETYQGHPVLVWWAGALNGPGGQIKKGSRVMVVNEHYRTLASIQAVTPWLADIHDAQIQGGNIWIVAWRIVSHQDLAPYGGPLNGSLFDYGLQEYNLHTGRLVYKWDALNPGGPAHVPLSQSYQPPPPPSTSGPSAIWDPYHLNSLQLLPHGRMLISMRNTWGVYLLDRSTGHPIWTLGGKNSSFHASRGIGFAWQHDAHLVTSPHGGGTRLTLFDDHCCRTGTFGSQPSRGMIISLNLKTSRASLSAVYRHSPPLVVPALGSMQLLSGGNVLIDWGGEYLSEYTRSGRKLLEVRWPGVDTTYRGLYTDTWVGSPYYPPAGAVRQVHGHTVVYASWNGATEVARWAVLAGSSKGKLTRVGTQTRTGFETRITLTRRYNVYEVQALSARGRVLRTSSAFS